MLCINFSLGLIYLYKWGSPFLALDALDPEWGLCLDAGTAGIAAKPEGRYVPLMMLLPCLSFVGRMYAFDSRVPDHKHLHWNSRHTLMIASLWFKPNI